MPNTPDDKTTNSTGLNDAQTNKQTGQALSA